jgi:hypothetical protein
MKIYNTKKDKYGWPTDSSEYIRNMCIYSGTKGEIVFEMAVWNFVAKIVNYFTRR